MFVDETTPASQALANAAVLFDGGRLRLARLLAGLRKHDVATALAVSATAVVGWESGAYRPTPANVAQLALSLSVEPGFFTVRPDDVAASSSTPHFRSVRSTSQLRRDQAYAYGHVAVDVAATLHRHVEFPAPDVPTWPVPVDDAHDDGPEVAARHVRDRWALGSGPLGPLIRLVENHGVLVVFGAPSTAAVGAYSFDSRSRPVIVLNPLNRDYYRQRFELAHELGHLVMHGDAEPGGRVAEGQADRFAAELLLPAAELRGVLPVTMRGGVWVFLGRLKEQWGVSMVVLLDRARRLGTLSPVSHRNALATVTARGWRRGEPGLVNAIEQPSLLPRAVAVLGDAGVDELLLVQQCRVPLELFRVVTSRAPHNPPPGAAVPPAGGGANIVSLLRCPTPE